MIKLCKEDTSCFIGGNTLEGIEAFNWDNNYQELKSNCPTLTSLLVSALTSKWSVKTLSFATRQHNSIKLVLGCLTPVILYNRRPRVLNNFQQLNSLQLRLAGCKREVFARFSHLGLCTGLFSTRSTIDRIRKNYNADVYEWKKKSFRLPPATTRI
ncbi:hypothetical protein SNE40_012035 [Patella caerulea]|uniref:Uncharacterized protein n=1 Tax=Patella caerulea TaxID=87958 RepID=A0AAN8PYZ8_PATCE